MFSEHCFCWPITSKCAKLSWQQVLVRCKENTFLCYHGFCISVFAISCRVLPVSTCLVLCNDWSCIVSCCVMLCCGMSCVVLCCLVSLSLSSLFSLSLLSLSLLASLSLSLLSSMVLCCLVCCLVSLSSLSLSSLMERGESQVRVDLPRFHSFPRYGSSVPFTPNSLPKNPASHTG